MPMSASTANQSGMLMRSKKGAPTVTFPPLTASTTSGNSVPSSTAKAIAVKSTLLTRNPPSRLTTPSSSA